MKLIITILLFVSCNLSAQTDTSFHIYLLAGQSNMAGRGDVDSLSKQTDPRILMLNKNNEWVMATDPVHFDKPVAGVGPAIAFAKEMLKVNPNIKIGLVPAAVGGSSIKVWQKDSMFIGVHPYDDALAHTKFAMRIGILKGILWHQGESDNSPQGAETYIERLSILINLFRSEFNNDHLPFVAGELGYFHKDRINTALRQLITTVKYTSVVSAEGLTANADNIHFNTVSARQLGVRYAIAMKALQDEIKQKK